MSTATVSQAAPSTTATKTIAIVQSSYIPWKGYFDLIRSVDEFVLFDDVQYTRRDWRNRNKIKTAQGIKWLTIPVEVKGRYHQRIRDAVVSDPTWAQTHWQSLQHSYGRADFFSDFKATFESLYLGMTERHLSQINRRFIEAVCNVLQIRTPLRWSSEYDLVDGATQRLVAICKQAGATEYLSGPSARNYLDEQLFHDAGIRVRYMDYSGYPEYRQLHPPFEHAVSVLDLIFNEGPNAATFLAKA